MKKKPTKPSPKKKKGLTKKQISVIEDELISIKTEIIDLKKTLTQKEDKDRIALLEERVIKAEYKLAQLR